MRRSHPDTEHTLTATRRGHTHHYEIHDDFYDSWLANHPRRSGEAYWNQYIEAAFIEDNSIPQGFGSIDELVRWFQPLFEIEARARQRC